MRTMPRLFLACFFILWIAGLMVFPGFAKGAANCGECHSRQEHPDSILSLSPSSIADLRSVYHAKLDPCPAIRSFSQEVFFTESRVLKLNQILKAIESERGVLEGQMTAIAESFSSLKNRGKISAAQFARESLVHRTALQKIYDRTLKIRDESSRRQLIGLGSLLFFGLLALGAIGYRKLGRLGKPLLLFLFLGVSLSGGACFYAYQAPPSKVPAQERLEGSLAAVTQTSRGMQEAFSQSVLMADLGREWAKLEGAAAEEAFRLSWQMALRARESGPPAAVLEEVLSRWPDQEAARAQGVDYNAVLDLRDELRSLRGRTWALRAVAEEWGRAGLPQGRSALHFASQETLKIEDAAVRDRELQPLAEAWAGIDEDRALEFSRSIRDPLGKALSLTRLALATRIPGRDGQLLEEAWKEAESVSPLYSQMRAFMGIAVCGAQKYPEQRNSWAARVAEKIQSLPPQLRAYSLQEMIALWAPLDWDQAERWAAGIDRNFSTPKAYSFIRIAQTAGVPGPKALELWKRALAEASAITDTGEALKIRSLIARGIFEQAPQEALRILRQVEDPFYRSEILEQLAVQAARRNMKEARELAEKIPWEPFRMRAGLFVAGQWILPEAQKVDSLYQEAFRVALKIPDAYERSLTLMESGRKWTRVNPGKARDVLDAAEKSAEQIASLPLRAELLESLAESWKGLNPQRARVLLERAGPSMAEARHTLEKIRLWVKADPMRAKEWAEAFPSSFGLEKAAALKEVAGAMKKSDPALALDLFGKAFHQALTLPEGPKTYRLLSQLVAEAALLDSAGTFHRLLSIPDREMREALLREAGSAWVQQDGPFAFKQALIAVGEIREGSLRWALWQKIVEKEALKPSLAATPESQTQPVFRALSYWGQGRGKGRGDETKAVPFYLQALEEVQKIEDLQERSYFLDGLAAEWATVDEEKALEVAGRISPDFPEPYSHALLQVGSQLRKWNRRKAREIFDKTLAAAEKVPDPSLRAQRFLQLAQQWYFLDAEKGQTVLKMAEREARKIMLLPAQENRILTAILITRCAWEPGEARAIASEAPTPVMEAKIFLTGAEVLREEDFGGILKILEKSLAYAQKEKNPRLLGEVAVAWSARDPDKAMDIIAQVGPVEIRIRSLLRIAAKLADSNKDKAKDLLEQALQEASKIDGAGDKIKHWKEIADAWSAIDKEQAKKIYRQAYQTAVHSFPLSLGLPK